MVRQYYLSREVREMLERYLLSGVEDTASAILRRGLRSLTIDDLSTSATKKYRTSVYLKKDDFERLEELYHATRLNYSDIVNCAFYFELKKST